MELKKIKRVEKTGKVVSDKMDKTRVVEVVRKVKHPFYSKYIKKIKRLMVHDEANMTSEGDVVKVVQCKPFSRHKRWFVKEILEKRERGQ